MVNPNQFILGVTTRASVSFCTRDLCASVALSPSSPTDTYLILYHSKTAQSYSRANLSFPTILQLLSCILNTQPLAHYYSRKRHFLVVKNSRSTRSASPRHRTSNAIICFFFKFAKDFSFSNETIAKLNCMYPIGLLNVEDKSSTVFAEDIDMTENVGQESSRRE